MAKISSPSNAPKGAENPDIPEAVLVKISQQRIIIGDLIIESAKVASMEKPDVENEINQPVNMEIFTQIFKQMARERGSDANKLQILWSHIIKNRDSEEVNSFINKYEGLQEFYKNAEKDGIAETFASVYIKLSAKVSFADFINFTFQKISNDPDAKELIEIVDKESKSEESKKETPAPDAEADGEEEVQDELQPDEPEIELVPDFPESPNKFIPGIPVICNVRPGDHIQTNFVVRGAKILVEDNAKITISAADAGVIIKLSGPRSFVRIDETMQGCKTSPIAIKADNPDNVELGDKADKDSINIL